MKKALKIHKASLTARQESLKMRERPKPQANRQESPLFEPDHTAAPVTLESQHDDDDEVRPEEHTSSLNARKAPPVDETTLPEAVSRKRKAEEISNIDDENESDPDDSEDDGDEIADRHDPDSEPLPDLPMYHPSVKLVETECTSLVSKFQYYIQNHAYKDNETEYLLEDSKKLEHAPHENHVLRIAVVGDAGQGKSSLLNSMLGHANLANHEANGKSCTYVVVEYAQAAVTQQTPFQASVHFHSRQACHDMIREQVINHFLYLKLTMSTEADEDDLSESRLGSTTCIKLLTSLFMGRPEFQDADRAKEFLSEHASADDPRLVTKLRTWTGYILDAFMPARESTDVATVYANTPSSISEAISPFTSEVAYPTFAGTDIVCCPWPFVKSVRVSLDSRILSQGIIIADLPGTTDKIRSRVEAAKRYLRSCDMTVIVNRMERAIDHASMNNAINEAFNRRKSGSLMVVCTHADGLDPTSKQSFQSTPAEEKIMAEILEREAKVTKQLQEVGVALRSPAMRKNKLEKFELTTKRDRIERQKTELGRKRFEVRVSARNRYVKQGISEQYRQDTNDRSPLPIFCVSNPIYMQHLSGGYLKKTPPQLTLEATEVPALRTHLFSQPSLGRFASLEHYCRSLLPTFLNTIEISCSVSKIKRKEDLNRTFHKARAGLCDTVQEVADEFSQLHFDLIYNTIANNEVIWINRARRKCERWAEKLKPPGYAAVLRHYGDWGTKKIEPQKWNRDLLIGVDEQLNKVFEQIHDKSCDTLSTDIAERVGEAVEKLNDALNVDPAASLSGAIKAFRENLKERRIQIDKICDTFKVHLKKEIRRIQVSATTDDAGHYFTEAMKEVYKTALKAPPVRGQRVHDVRSGVFLRGVTAQNGVFLNIGQAIREDFEAMFKRGTEQLVKKLDNVFSKTQHDVNMVCSTKEDDSPEAKKMREGLLAMLPEARERLEKEIWKELAKCKQGRFATKTEE